MPDGEFLHTTCWPVYLHDGGLYTFDLWRKDLELHFDYLDSMTLASPIVDGPPPKDASRIRPDIAERIRLVHVPSIINGWTRLRNTPSFVLRILFALRRASVFQCILVEYPILFGMLLPFLRRFSDVRLVTFVESSSWRRPRSGPLVRLYSRLCEAMARRAVAACHVSLHTQEEYRRSLAREASSAYVIPAVWIDESDIVAEDALRERLERRSAAGASITVGFFGWFIPDKGLDILVRAAALCLERGADIRVAVVGDGPEAEACKALAAPWGDRIRFLGTFPYGAPFFEQVASCDAVAIPNRMTEHVRITVDAMAQGVPVLGSDVPGLRQFVEEGKTGRLFPAGDVEALASVLSDIASDPERLRGMSLHARAKVAGMSHRRMHAARADALRKELGAIPPIRP